MMWARVLGLLGIVIVSVFIGYLIGSSGVLQGFMSPPQPAASPFLVSNLSIKPAEVQPNEPVTITVSVANTHHTWGIYSLVLKINGVKEAEMQANVDARSIEDVSFRVARENPGRYAVFINGLSGSFTVAQPKVVSKQNSQEIAIDFLRNSPTFRFDGIEQTLELVQSQSEGRSWEFQYEFQSRHAGYGDRTGLILAQVITDHRAQIVVERGEVIHAVLDGKWDMLSQKIIKESK